MSKPANTEDLVLVGAIAGAFGVKGEVRVRAFTAEADGVCAYGPLLDEQGSVVLTPKRWRPIKDAIAVTAPEVATREEAEALRGVRLYVPRTRFPEPEENEFYAVDLIGCRVELADGTPLGEITAVQDYGGGDMLEIKQGGKLWRLPFTAENAPHIDLKQKLLIADPPAGLLEDQ